MRPTSFAVLAARSPWAPAAVLCWDWMPALTIARSGFLETVASPVVRMPVSIVDDDVVAALTNKAGRLAATTIAATASVETMAKPIETATTRSVVDMQSTLLLRLMRRQRRPRA